MQDVQSWKLPLIWLNRLGKPEPDPHKERHPFLMMQFAAPTDGSRWSQSLAMIDTGATFTIISPAAVAAAGVISTGTKEMAGNWATTHARKFSILLRATGAEPFEVATEVTELGLSAEGFLPPLVLGLDYLRYGRLVIDQFGPESFFELQLETIKRAMATSPAPVPGGSKP